jgi:putative transposase
MARHARVVVPGYPHHITQRGNRRQQTFFELSDYLHYLGLLTEECMKSNVEIWAYCLMPNHVHLIAVPATENNLHEAVGRTHMRYTKRVNQRMEWTGYLWQGRFASFPMDETYLLATARYIELNPVRANLVKHPEDFQWSSASHNLGLTDDPVIKGSPLKEMIGNWNEFLMKPYDEKLDKKIRLASRGGRPLGSEQFVSDLERQVGRTLQPQKPGPK